MHIKAYPYHPTLINTLKTVDAALVGARLIRRLMAMLVVGHKDVEILIGLAGRLTPATFDDVCDIMADFTKDKVRRLIKSLDDRGFIDKHPCDDDYGFTFTAKSFVINAIESVDKVSVS